jgi:hypothetical protein
MKVYLEYYEKRCAYCDGHLCDRDDTGYCYIWDEGWEGEHAQFKGICPNIYPSERIICKEAKNIEIVKDINQGFVQIGRKQWPMDDIILLKVDYGDGWVIEIEQEGNDEV